MRYVRFCFFVTLTVIFAATAAAQTQRLSITQPLQSIGAVYSRLDPHINEVAATVDDRSGVETILRTLPILNAAGARVAAADMEKKFKDKDFYCIIHVVSLADPAGNPPATTQTVRAQNWYLYHKGKLTRADSDTMPRLYGAKEVTLLYLHLNKKTPYEPLYEVDIVKKTPAYLQNLLGLAGLFNSGGVAAGSTAADETWAAYTFTVEHRPSDITIQPNMTIPAGVVELGDAQKFDNEGKYFVDFSVGVPVRKISQLSFESTNGLVTAKEVDETNIMAFVNLHPRPIDVKSTGYNKVPHFVGGVAIGKKPLDKIFVGAGFGPVVANFYVGALFVKQDQLTTLDPGDPATPAQVGSNVRRRYKTQVGFGLNLPVGAIVEKLKNK